MNSNAVPVLSFCKTVLVAAGSRHVEQQGQWSRSQPPISLFLFRNGEKSQKSCRSNSPCSSRCPRIESEM
uniref:Uncharacterized protein n=1 Tax=Solanum tuberosum TaxID=4113 RepID=M1D9Y5_SOLTU